MLGVSGGKDATLEGGNGTLTTALRTEATGHTRPEHEARPGRGQEGA